MLDANCDVPDQELVQLEIAFLPLLEHTKRKFLAILRHARENPDCFVELLRLEFRRRDGEEDDDLKELSKERRKHLFDVSFNILHKFDAIPGLDGTGPQAAQHMRSWISQALELAAQVGRREVAEQKIGGALARAPVIEGEPWPPDDVCDVIEEFWSDHLARGFLCGCINKLGVRPVDAGRPDKVLAAEYSAWGRFRQISYPHVCALLNQLSRDFARSAKRHGINADVRRQIE